MSSESRHLSIAIERPVATVYEYACDPTNLPQWAAGLASTTVELQDGQWVAGSPMGRVTVSFAERNDFGVLDHVVTLPSGESVYNPLRVIPDGEASEVVFTLRRRRSMTDDEFDQDAEAVRTDLESLKRVLETPSTDR
ncbi:SRPBCC family protein [Janibacter sp. GS2]|uniref:SRPBCC family protein n=1 Tax=Janibacter sp. GS2 TaxID=3442646 RepID=UPI003EB9A645